MTTRIEFDWDATKAATNLVKHDVSFDEAMLVFADPLALSRPEGGSSDEERWVTIGVCRDTKLLLVVHTHVELSVSHVYIGSISARKPTRAETCQYEQKPN
jgi:uncharacterized protein